MDGVGTRKVLCRGLKITILWMCLSSYFIFLSDKLQLLFEPKFVYNVVPWIIDSWLFFKLPN